MTYFVRRLGSLIPVMLGVLTITFFLIHLIPGDPVDIMLGDYTSQTDRESLRRELGLHLPVAEQFKSYLWKCAHFDFGRSLQSQKPVWEEIRSRVPATFELGLAALLLAALVGIPLGVVAAIHKNTLIDRIILVFGSLGISFPSLWSGPLLIWLFAVELDWLPVGERESWDSLILPAISLSIGMIALLARMTRSSMLDVLREDYISVARAKGLSYFQVYYVHGLTNAIIPVLTILGLMLGALLTGTVIVETIFDWPGIGLLLYQAIQNRDYPLVQGCVLFVSFIYLIANFLTDLAYAFFNPKIRLEA